MVLEIKNITKEDIKLNDLHECIDYYIKKFKKEQNKDNTKNIRLNTITCYISFKDNNKVLNDGLNNDDYINNMLSEELSVLDLYVWYCNNSKNMSIKKFCEINNLDLNNTFKYLDSNKYYIDNNKKIYNQDIEFQVWLDNQVYNYFKIMDKNIGGENA